MYTVTLADVLTADIRGEGVIVDLTAEIYIDHKRPRERVHIAIRQCGLTVIAHDDDALSPRIAVSRELVHAARLFGKML